MNIGVWQTLIVTYPLYNVCLAVPRKDISLYMSYMSYMSYMLSTLVVTQADKHLAPGAIHVTSAAGVDRRFPGFWCSLRFDFDAISFKV